jgi:hypothetical protein
MYSHALATQLLTESFIVCDAACSARTEVHTLAEDIKTPSGFGGITRGVIKAASVGGKRAPVMRLEELHQVRQANQICLYTTRTF